MTVRYVLLAGVVLFESAAASAAGGPETRLTARAFREAIKTEGADKVVRRLFEDQKMEEVLLRGIGTGGHGWLDVAATLRPLSDASVSEGLDIAIQDALPRNPVGVLMLVHKGAFSVQSACGNYGKGQIEDARPMSVIQTLVHLRIKAVTQLKVPSVAVERRECLGALADLAKQLARR